MGRLLAARGIGPEAAADYLAPTLRALLPDPAVLRDMGPCADRLAAAARAGERVAVFADYDVDGACSGALLVRVLRQLGADAFPYVPDRLAEGYGPNAAAVSALCDRGATLIACVDCGIAAHVPLDAARGRADVVILDHHLSEGPPPAVLAAVNPNRLDCGSGLRTLCAAAVAFLAAVATVRALRRSGHFAARPEPDLLALLDLVALATVCDVMPLTGLNRALVAQGLRVMARRGRAGVAALLEVAESRDAPDARALGWALGPRINAGGRIGRSDLGLLLLLTDDPVEARELALRLDAANTRRKEIEAAVLAAARAQAAPQAEAGRPVLLVASADWHPGVVGIVAGRLKERFGRPVLVAGIADGMARGSGRSVEGVDLGAAVIAARQAGLLAAGGGHAMAAGFTCAAGDLEAFHAALEARLPDAASRAGPAELPVAGALAVGGATVAVAEAVARLGPFGQGNDEPVFALPRVRVVKADRVGRDGATVRAFLEGEAGGRLKAVCFRAQEGPLAALLLAGDRAPVHLCGRLRAERWNDAVTAGLHVEDAAPAA